MIQLSDRWRSRILVGSVAMAVGLSACSSDSDSGSTNDAPHIEDELSPRSSASRTPSFDANLITETEISPVGVTATDSELYVGFLDGTIQTLDLDVLADGELQPFTDLSDEIDGIAWTGLAAVEYSETTGLLAMYHGDGGVIVVAPLDSDGNLGDGRIEIDNVCADHSGNDIQMTADGELLVSYGDDALDGAACWEEWLWNPDSAPASISEVLDPDGTLPAGQVLRVDADAVQEFVAGSTLSIDRRAVDLSPGVEVIADGLRNPWRINLDEETAQLWIGDVGSITTEEINVVDLERDSLPVNFGWPAIEGDAPVDEFDTPIAERDDSRLPWFSYGRSVGQTIVAGPVLSEGPLAGAMVFGDFGTGEVSIAEPTDDATATITLALTSAYRPVHFELLPDGQLLMAGHQEPAVGGGLVLLTPG